MTGFKLIRAWAVLGLMAACVSAQELEIADFSLNGTVSWTNAVEGEDYGVFWASSLNGPWSCSWNAPGMISATGSMASASVPLFYRVVRWPMEGLVAHYPFTLGPDDAGVNGFTSTAINVSRVLDRSGNGIAYTFDGSTSYIDCGDHPEMECSTGVTVAAWIKTTSTNSTSAVGGKFGGSGGYYLAANSMKVAFSVGNTSYAVTYFPPISNEWFFVAGTWKPGETVSYVNGVQAGRSGTPFSMGPSTYPFTIGCRFFFGDSSWPFEGAVDDLRVFGRALTSNEIWALYHYPR